MQRQKIVPNSIPLNLTPDPSGRMSKELLKRNGQQMMEIADLLQKTLGDVTTQRKTRIIVSDGESPCT